MKRAVVLIALALLAACAKPTPAPVAAQSPCPETLSDVDRLACWAAARPEPAPDARKPSALLSNPNGTAIIGPKPSAPPRNPDGSLVIGPGSSQ